MGFLERAIRRGVSDAVGKAIGNAVTQAVEPKATEIANKAANAIDQAAQNTEQQVARSSGLESAMANLERSVQSYATEAAKNMKVCPNCNKPTTADKKFCPECGTQLPEQTVAQGAVCPSCGKQTAIGTKFCQDCGTKLPAAVEEERQAAARNAAVLEEWCSKLAVYPVWSMGGRDLNIENYDGTFAFSATFDSYQQGKAAVEQYRALLQQSGFVSAGQYPSPDQLYKMENGVCYHVDLGNCFEGSPECPTIGFNVAEPAGGYDYVKPEPPKQLTLSDIRGLFKK